MRVMCDWGKCCKKGLKKKVKREIWGRLGFKKKKGSGPGGERKERTEGKEGSQGSSGEMTSLR